MFGRTFVICLLGMIGGWLSEVRDECGVVNPASRAGRCFTVTFWTQTTDAKKKSCFSKWVVGAWCRNYSNRFYIILRRMIGYSGRGEGRMMTVLHLYTVWRGNSSGDCGLDPLRPSMSWMREYNWAPLLRTANVTHGKSVPSGSS